MNDPWSLKDLLTHCLFSSPPFFLAYRERKHMQYPAHVYIYVNSCVTWAFSTSMLLILFASPSLYSSVSCKNLLTLLNGGIHCAEFLLVSKTTPQPPNGEKPKSDRFQFHQIVTTAPPGTYFSLALSVPPGMKTYLISGRKVEPHSLCSCSQLALEGAEHADRPSPSTMVHTPDGDPAACTLLPESAKVNAN